MTFNTFLMCLKKSQFDNDINDKYTNNSNDNNNNR